MTIRTTLDSMVRQRERLLAWLPSTLTRLTLGVVFAQSGWGKLQNLDDVAAFFAELHIPWPYVNATVAAAVEFGGGLLVLVGLLTRLASLPLIFVMMVAIATAKMSEVQGVGDFLGLNEFAYLVMFVWLVFFGAGPLSIDAAIRRR